MDGLVSYCSSGEEEDGSPHTTSQDVLDALKSKLPLNSAPPVPMKESPLSLLRVDPKAKQVAFNPTVDQLFTPEVGPVNPFKTRQQKADKNILTGHVEPAHFDHFQFENQRRTFHSYGYAVDPTASSASAEVIGERERAGELEGVTVFEAKTVSTGVKRKRLDKGDPGEVDGYEGPWRAYVDQVTVSKPTEKQMAVLEEQLGERKKKRQVKETEETIVESSLLHVDNPYDYLGRSYLHIPQDQDVDLRTDDPPDKCYAPTKLIHTWAAHNKVSAIRLFPGSGHLLLSSGMDSKIKLWEVYNDRRCLRTFLGHGKAVRDISFNNDGSKFLSCSYDRYVKQWDTETGACIGRYGNGKTPYCVRFNPDEDKQNLFVVGCSDKKVYAWDTVSGEAVQEYDRHLGAVNTITFVDQNRRFVTTSDDKSLRVWEWDIPVDMKYVAEPAMHSMPSVTVHPTGKWLGCQSMDNKIMVFGVHNNFRLNRKKTFRGHMVSGYACQLDFSPDGTYVVSGDADGKLTVWEWRSTRIFTRFKAHESVCIGCAWLPHETSKVITCGWDGNIKLWD
ncbi:pre-mRNA-processing factor 17-like isoform X2 [Halichondria panicea]|uniref:pre-mRNA-processing factor 17-like isoform X2 n=1 Tax=Halichondria panicea TaxID=6063 RepID=UPI00312BB73C